MMQSNLCPTGETIWITGASSGIGRQLAINLAAAGNQVIVTARNLEALKELEMQHAGIRALDMDISHSRCVAPMTARLRDLTPVIDRLFINAGACEYFEVNDPDWTMMERIMAVNYLGAVHCLAAALPLLKRANQGHIIAMASQASRVPFPRAQAYGASKAALTYLIESLGVDLADTPITTSIVQLGFVKTPMTAENDFPMPFAMTTEQTAERLIAELMARPRVIRFPRRLSGFISVARLFPAFWYQVVAPRLSRAS
ncbi:MAG: SDR family NAD(P)-dependent oxidoreductase [Cellvibrionaceae bacterium]